MPLDANPAAPPRLGPQLLPGALLLRRDDRTLQVGTSPGILVRDRPGLGRVLRLLDGSLPLSRLRRVVARDVPEFGDDLGETLQRLTAAGAVISDPPPRSLRVAVRHDRSTAAFADLLAPLVGRPALEPEVEIVVTAGEPRRSTFEVLIDAAVTHLSVVLTEHHVRIGPLVVPGSTPCMNCLDELLRSCDPAWTALVPQFERTRLLPIALSPSLLLRAAAETTRQIERLAEGHRPSTVGQVLSVGPAHDHVTFRSVPFAPTCLCRVISA